jgi:hypothetical protein
MMIVLVNLDASVSISGFQQPHSSRKQRTAEDPLAFPFSALLYKYSPDSDEGFFVVTVVFARVVST